MEPLYKVIICAFAALLVIGFVFGGSPEYEVVETNDLTTSGWYDNMNIKIIVPDDSTPEQVDNAMEDIIDEYGHYDYLTIWAWKFSEEDQVGKIPYTMGMKEWSRR